MNHDQTDGTRDSTDFKITNGYLKLGYEINPHLKALADINLADFNANDMGSIYAEPVPFNIDIQRGKTSFSLENHYDKMQGAFKYFLNFGEHNLSDGWHSTDRNMGAMLYESFKLFKGNSITAGVDLKQYGGKGNGGKYSDTMLLVEEFAGYAYMQQTLLKKLTVSAGLRVENNSDFGTELVPMAGVNYCPLTSTTFKASVSKGFRSPTIMEKYLYAPNPDLEPERMMNYEVSWLQSLMKSKVSTELTLFIAEGENMIEVVGSYPNVIRQNVGSFTNKGIEFSTKVRATKDLFFNANYSYLNTNKKLLAAPEHQINVNANYSYKIFSLNLSIQHIRNLYTSTSLDTKENYTLLNARISTKAMKNINIFVSANNLLDEYYEINYGYPMPGINFTGGLKLAL